jgi:hypothetical protein
VKAWAVDRGGDCGDGDVYADIDGDAAADGRRLQDEGEKEESEE